MPSSPSQDHNCGNTVLTRGTPPSGITWYWQGTSCGTSTSNSSTTYTANSDGTYYLRARNNTTGCWSSCRSISVDVNEIPTSPSTPTVQNNCGNSVLTRGTPPSGITWYWQGTSCGTSTSNSSATYTANSDGTYYLRARNNTSGCWSTSCANVIVDVNELPATPSTPSVIYNCNNTDLIRETPPSGITWYWQGTSCETSTSNSSTTYNITSQSTIYLRAQNDASECWSTSCVNISENVYDCPSTPENPTVIFEKGSTEVTREASPPGETIYWQTSSSGTSTSDASITKLFTESTTRYLRSRKNTSPNVWSDAKEVPVNVSDSYPFPEANKNYVVIQTPQEPETDTSNLSTDPEDVLVTTEFFDGIGRLIQTIQLQSSPLGNDIVTPISYDTHNRLAKSYLPFTMFENPGNYVGNQITKQQSFYGELFPGESEYAFAEKKFESSPLNRVIEQGAPGEEWQITQSQNPLPYPIKFSYASIHANEVYKWKINSGDCEKDGYYSLGELFESITFNENGDTTIEYKNKQKQVVLKKSFHYGDSLEIHYVYDDKGLLRFVIPPEAFIKIKENNDIISDGVEDSLIYSYTYDVRNRMIIKKIPGAKPINMVYDKTDRLVLTQDGNLRDEDQWLFTKYDVFGRPIMTGIYTNHTITTRDGIEAELEQYVNNSTTFYYEDRDNTTNTGYTDQAFPPLGSSEEYTITYYDDKYIDDDQNEGYCFFSGTWESYTDDETGFPDNEVSTYNNGRIVGTLTKVLGDEEMLKEVFFYDKYGRIIQINKETYPDGSDIVTNQLDFTGKLDKVKIDHITEIDETETDVILWKYFTYDPVGRLTKVELEIEGDTENGKVTLAKMEYDELGQLEKKELHEKTTNNFLETIDYSYNIRGWLTNINDPDNIGDDQFAMKLMYNDPSDINSLSPIEQYNGNISGMIWKSSERGPQAYCFAYDPLNRLLKAQYGSYDSGWHEEEDYTVKGIAYDFNGNIDSLTRYGDDGLIDSLIYEYYSNSNQLKYVIDTSEVNTGFSDGSTSGGSIEYEYDDNGNLISDANKSIESISYNHLNLPELIDFGNNDYLEFIYDANGNKLAKIKYDNDIEQYCIYYIGDLVYMDEELDFILTEEGRITNTSSNYNYEYFLRDHLGNTRIVLQDGTSGLEILQETDYYPFGLKFESETAYQNNDNYYLYNGKEFQDDLGLDWYDYGARFYDPAVCRWFVMDRFTEKFHTNTPYNYALNNSIINVDINGDTTYRFDNNGIYLGMFDLDQQGIRGSMGRNKTYEDKDGNEQSMFITEVNFNFNDPSVDKEQLNLMEVGEQGLQIVTEENINDIMNESNIEAKGFLVRHFFAGTESGSDRDFGKGNEMDFGPKYLGGQPGGGGNDTQGGFFLFGDQRLAYNAMDAGNWLWGQGMKRLGFDYSTAKFVSELNEGFKDSPEDQNAILKGYHYVVKTNNAISFILKNK